MLTYYFSRNFKLCILVINYNRVEYETIPYNSKYVKAGNFDENFARSIILKPKPKYREDIVRIVTYLRLKNLIKPDKLIIK